MMPWISGSRFSRRIVGEQVVLGHESGQVDLLGADADVGAGLVLGADVDAGGLVVAHEDGGEARAARRRSARAMTRCATSERICAAIALPSMIVAVTARNPTRGPPGPTKRAQRR